MQKVVRHGRYITFQMAEVAIPRQLFAAIMQSISALITTLGNDNMSTPAIMSARKRRESRVLTCAQSAFSAFDRA